MRPTDLLRTSAFRLTLVYLAVLGVFGFAGFRFLYSASLEALQEESRQIVRAELEGLAEHYRAFGPLRLSAVIDGRSRREGRSLYLLADGRGRKAAGNLASWPETAREAGKWHDFHYLRAHDGEPPHRRTARAYVANLPDGFRLLVAHDIDEEIALSRRIVVFGAAAGSLILLAGLAAGVLVSRDLRRRAEAVDETGRRIMEDGDLSRRVPVTGRGDEFDDLANSVNRMLARIEVLMNELREVTDDIAHDLRRPLARLHARLEDVLRGPVDAGGYRAALVDTALEVRELIDTFNMLLAIARAESGSEAAAAVDLAGLAEDLVELHQPLAEERGIALEFAKEGPVPGIEGQPELLAQALSNLIDNAVKYTPPGGRVSVTAGPAGIAVADSGPGIAPEDRERALDRFVRLDPSRHLPGNGLGLALAAAAARRHNARLVLADAAPGSDPPGLRASLEFAAP